jgi:uncharacterized protein YecE (DUF72 family)
VRDLPPKLHLGTSSFSSEDWVGPFYPAGTKAGDMLAFYASKFETVEIDATYYRPPTPQMCARWEAVTPRGFTFALKVPKIITHDQALVGIEKEWESLLGAVSPLGEKLAFLVLQFPYWNRSSAIPDLSTFLRRLDAFAQIARSPCALVVETRNPKWIGKDLIDLLHSRRYILALQDQQWMPRPRELWEKWEMKLRTGDSVYIRMLGEREKIESITKTWEKAVLDRSGQTAEWLPILRSLLAQEVDIDMYFNNHYEGHAPTSIDRLRQMWNTGFTKPPEGPGSTPGA